MPPMAQLGSAEIALMVGEPSAQVAAVASVKEGRILRRLDATAGKQITRPALLSIVGHDVLG